MKSTASPDTSSVQSLLEDLQSVIAGSQVALLAGRVQELESCVARQRELCHQLESTLQALSSTSNHSGATPGLVETALSARDQNRVFSAVLRRMRQNLEIMRNSLAGLETEYEARRPVPERPSL